MPRAREEAAGHRRASRRPKSGSVQIDNPYVDWRSNALMRVKQTYRGFGPYVAQVSLRNNYRGPISKKADEL